MLCAPFEVVVLPVLGKRFHQRRLPALPNSNNGDTWKHRQIRMQKALGGTFHTLHCETDSLILQGRRAVLWSAKSKSHPDRFFSWALDVERRRGHNNSAS